MPLSIEREPSNSYQLPPGFRFHPSDEELIVHYLQNKASSRPLPVSIIAEIDLFKYNPWELPKKALYGDDEWFFFSPRDRKYPNGVRPNRSAGSGYWKATGTDRPILTSSGCKSIGVKKALVFYQGRPPKGLKTEWVMIEYRLLDTTIKPSKSKGSMRLDDWVLCRVRHKGNELSTKTCEVEDKSKKVLVRYLPKAEEELPAAYSNYNNDMIRDCLNKNCPILAYILAGQTFPAETISSTSFQGSDKDNIVSSIFEDDSENSLITVSSFDLYNSVKRKSNYEYRQDNLLPSGKRLNSGNKTEDLVPASESLRNNDLNYFSENQSQVIFYNPNPSDSITGFLELDELQLNGNYLP